MAALVALLGVVPAVLGARALVEHAITGTLDARLRAAVDLAAPAARAGATPVARDGTVRITVLDRRGDPVDGGPPPGVGRDALDDVLAGEAVWLDVGSGDAVRGLGRVVTAPDGSQHLVFAQAGQTGVDGLRTRATVVAVLTALAAVAVTAGVAGIGARAALRSVSRLRVVAADLPEGARLPVPARRDELTALARGVNDLLARRDHTAERLRRFTGDAAHELRSPVAAIRAQAEVAALYPDPETAAETLADVAIEAQRLSALLDDLLALARSDAGHRLPTEPVDLAVAAADAIARIGVGAVRLTAPAPAVVDAAPGDVARVLDNLLTNAVRHARAEVRVAVLVGSVGVLLLVDDDGPGVPEEHRGAVFDRFHRVQEGRERDSGGTGLGLALVAETVRRHGGTVRVAAAPGGGARFLVRWPSGRTSSTTNPPLGGP